MTDQELDTKAQTENDKSENIRLNRVKAVDITIDSLKQYVTLSTVSIVALVALYNGNAKLGNFWFFISSISSFILCAVISVFTINSFINQLHFSIVNVRETSLRIKNFIAILLFAIGAVFAALFIFMQNPSVKTDNIKITFDNSILEIGNGVKAKINISTDTIRKTKIITIDKQ